MPDGTSDVGHGQSRTIEITVVRESWEVWTHPDTSEVIFKNQTSEPASFASLTASLAAGAGAVSSDAALDASGYGTASFTMDASNAEDGIVTLWVQDLNGAEGSAQVTFSLPGETWELSHYESAVRASLSSSGGTQGVPEGVETPLELAVTYETWAVEVSNYTRTRTADHSSSAAEGATLSWSVTGSGSLSADAQTDINGQATASFTMGTGNSVVSVQVSYAGSSSTSATMLFTPQMSEGPTFVGTRTVYQFAETTTLFENLLPPAVQSFSGQLMRRTEEVWQDENGSPYVEYASEWEPAANVSLSLYLVGDGVLSATSLTTDGSGNFSAEVAMNEAASTVVVSPVDVPEVEQVFYFLPPTGPPPVEPYYVRSEYAVSIQWDHSGDLSADPGTTAIVSGTLINSSWEVWTDGHTERPKNRISNTVNDATLHFAVTSGSATLSSSSVTTDGNGLFSVEVTTPSQPSSVVVTVYPSGGSLPIDSATILPLEEETWTDFGEPYAVQNLSVWASDYARNPNQTATIYAQVMGVSLIRQVSSRGNMGTRQIDEDCPVSGATVYFTVPNGAGGTVETQATTGSDGIATVEYTFGTTDGAVEATYEDDFSEVLNFVVTGIEWTEHQATVAKVTWNQVPAAGSLAPGATDLINAKVVSEKSKWYVSNFGQVTTPEVSTSPIEGAQVTFSILSSGVVPAVGSFANAGPTGQVTAVTDIDGYAQVQFTMGTNLERLVKATTAPLGTQVYATTTLSREPGWTHSHDLTSLHLEVDAPDYPLRSLRAWVRKHTQPVWQKGTEQRTMGVQVEALGGVTVNWSVDSGTAQLLHPTGETFSTHNSNQGSYGSHLNRVVAIDGAVIRASASLSNLTATDTFTIPTGVQDLDEDGDGLTNGQELGGGLNPWSNDTNGNGIPDALDDDDGDGWSNRDELALGSNPVSNQTDTAIHGYSTMNRLTSSSGGGRSFTYTYDPEGNINH